MTAAAFLATPYSRVHDAPVLMAGVAFLVQNWLERGVRSHDRVLLGLCWLLPAGLALAGSIITPAVCLILPVLAARRAGPARTWQDLPAGVPAVPAAT